MFSGFMRTIRDTTGNARGWDEEALNDIKWEREMYDMTEQPTFSMNVEIPQTQDVKAVQNGRLRLNNNTSTTGINNDNALYIIGNTYQKNPDGTRYGMGWDGRPYSYFIKNGVVGGFYPLPTDEQKYAINRITDGQVTVDDTIQSPGTLAQLYRAIERAQNYGGGKLNLGRFDITAKKPEADGLERAYAAVYGGKYESPSLGVFTNPNYQFYGIRSDEQSGFHPKTGRYAESVSTHELGHVVDRKAAADYYARHHSNYYLEDIAKRAADNLGFDTVEKAFSTISDYATENIDEGFAEAYTDVLLNGINAKSFSKELMSQYMQLIEESDIGRTKRPRNYFPTNPLQDFLTYNRPGQPIYSGSQFLDNLRTTYKK